jgi:septum formation protein
MLILASNSPRRKELLAGLGIPYDVLVIKGIDESYPDDLPANEVAEYIARKKAKAYVNDNKLSARPKGALSQSEATERIVNCPLDPKGRLPEQELSIILTADTIVVCDGEILGKPRDAEDACSMLRKLSGKTHQVYTGYCLQKGEKTVSGTVCSDVTFKELADEEITHYVNEYKPFDKAGAYGIQEWIGYIGITGIRGSYYNVMGLPVQRIYEELKKIGFSNDF